MAEDVKFRINLDGKSAKAALTELTNDAKKIGADVKRGLNNIGLGSVLGAAAGVTGAVSAGLGDVASGAFAGVGTTAEDIFLGEEAARARGYARARGEFADIFGDAANALGKTPPGIYRAFQERAEKYAGQEVGKNIILSDPEIGGIINRGVHEIVDAVKKAGEAMAPK